MFTLVIQSIWHGIIGAVIFINTPDNRVTPSMHLVRIDQIVFFVTIGLFTLIHIALLGWLYFVPLRHRNNMKKTGLEYERALVDRKGNQRKSTGVSKQQKSSPFARIPIES